MDQGAPKTMVEYRPPSKPEAAGMEETGRRGSTITEKARRKSKLGAKPSGYENDLTGNTREANLSVPSDAFKSMDYFSKDGSLHNYGSIKQEEGKRGGSRVVEEVKVPLTVTVVSEVLAKGGPPPSEKRHPSAKSKLPRSPQPTTSHKAPVPIGDGFELEVPMCWHATKISFGISISPPSISAGSVSANPIGFCQVDRSES